MLFASLFDASSLIIVLSFLSYGIHVMFKGIAKADTDGKVKGAAVDVAIRAISRLFK